MCSHIRKFSLVGLKFESNYERFPEKYSRLLKSASAQVHFYELSRPVSYTLIKKMNFFAGTLQGFFHHKVTSIFRRTSKGLLLKTAAQLQEEYFALNQLF